MPEIDPSLTTREALQAWLLSFHEATATLDTQQVGDKFFTDDAVCQYANNPEASGKENVLAFFNAAFNGLDLMTHDIVYFDFVAPNKLYQAATIRYLVKGDNPDRDMFTVPAMMTAWLEEQDGRLKIRRNEIYLDASALFARMHEKGWL